jgi:hypothetical protein
MKNRQGTKARKAAREFFPTSPPPDPQSLGDFGVLAVLLYRSSASRQRLAIGDLPFAIWQD